MSTHNLNTLFVAVAILRSAFSACDSVATIYSEIPAPVTEKMILILSTRSKRTKTTVDVLN